MRVAPPPDRVPLRARQHVRAQLKAEGPAALKADVPTALLQAAALLLWGVARGPRGPARP